MYIPARRRGPQQTYFPQIGTVTSRDTATYRVKVHLRLLDIETDWLRVASCYVGAGWGMVALPQVNNEVIVLFFDGDLNDGVVIGSLYSDNVDAPPVEEGGPVIVHQSGTVLRFREDGSIEIGGPGGAAVARVGDTVACPCGIGHITSGSSKVTCG